MEQYKIPSHLDMERKVEDFLNLLKQRELGLMTWQEARSKMASELYDMLGRVLGKDQVGVFCLEHKKVMTNGICPKCGQQ
jgi:hypothetical protein